MNGKDLADFRAKRGMTQKQLAELINVSLGRSHVAQKISKWEREVEPVPKNVQTFLTELQLEEALPSNLLIEPEYEPPTEDLPPLDGETGDSAPPPPPGTAEQVAAILPSGGRTIYARMCEEMFEMVATGIGLIAVATNNPTLTADSRNKIHGVVYQRIAQDFGDDIQNAGDADLDTGLVQVNPIVTVSGGNLVSLRMIIAPRVHGYLLSIAVTLDVQE